MNRNEHSLSVQPGRTSVWSKTNSSAERAAARQGAHLADEAPRSGLLIINADDWGRDAVTTNRILDCTACGVVSSVSGMVFMEDSERAAAIARERQIDVGLHLNLTTPFSGPSCPTRLAERQQELARYLLWHRLAQVMFHPGLIRSFEYVVAAQLDEFRRLHGVYPQRLDGHHHMHLCANVLWQGLVPRGTAVRRNFSFQSGEKSLCNRLYRWFVDGMLARHHCLTDFFFSLAPLEPPDRLERILSLARNFTVELETHPVRPDEYEFLLKGELLQRAVGIRIYSPTCATPRRAVVAG